MSDPLRIEAAGFDQTITAEPADLPGVRYLREQVTERAACYRFSSHDGAPARILQVDWRGSPWIGSNIWACWRIRLARTSGRPGPMAGWILATYRPGRPGADDRPLLDGGPWLCVPFTWLPDEDHLLAPDGRLNAVRRVEHRSISTACQQTVANRIGGAATAGARRVLQIVLRGIRPLADRGLPCSMAAVNGIALPEMNRLARELVIDPAVDAERCCWTDNSRIRSAGRRYVRGQRDLNDAGNRKAGQGDGQAHRPGRCSRDNGNDDGNRTHLRTTLYRPGPMDSDQFHNVVGRWREPSGRNAVVIYATTVPER